MQDNPFARLRRESVAVYASTYAGPLTAPSWTVTGALAVGGNTTLTGTLAVTGASAFTGAVTMASTLGVTGAATLSSTLAVTGATTLSAGLSGTTATFSSTFNATGAGTFGSTLAVTGATTLSAALSGTTGTFSSTLGVTGVLSANTIGVLTGTTATVYNTTATTVNAFGAATTLTLGASTGTCTIANATLALAGNLQSTVATQFIIQHVPASGAGSIRFSPLPFTTSDAATVDFFRVSNSTVFSAFTLFYGDGTSKKSFEHRIGASANSTWYDASAVAALTITNSTGAITTGMTTVSLWNTVATTVNFAGAASTALNIGNASGPITFAGKIVTTLSSTTRAYFNLPHGAAPSSPVNGDVWTTTAGLYVRINGSTVGPLS